MGQFFYTYYKKYGNKILMRYVKNGKPKNRIVDFYQPSLYVSTDDPSEAKNIYDVPVKKIEFENMKAAKSFADQYKDVDNFDIHGNSDFANQFIIELFDGKEPDYSADNIKIGIIDIEVTAEVFPDPDICRWPVTAITMFNSIDKEYMVFGLEHKDGTYVSDTIHDKIEKIKSEGFKVTYKPYIEELDLLKDYLTYMREQEFHLTSGWNSEGFDWPYLINRCYSQVGETHTQRMLSPFGMINKRTITDSYKNEKTKFEVVGVPDLDYMLLYKKHIFTPRESYKLDFIAEQELDEKKLDYSDYDSLENLYYDNYQLFINYNIMDVDLIRRLDEKLGLFQLTFALTYLTLTNMSETLGTVKIWEHLIAKHLYGKNKVPLFRGIKSNNRSIDGGFVMEPVPAMYDWTVAFDLNSLYPHIEMQYNIGPETRVSEEDLTEELLELRNNTLDDLVNGKVDTSILKKYNYAMTGNFQFYRKDKMSFFSEIKRDLYSKRKVFKKDMLSTQQLIADSKDSQEKKILESKESKANNNQMAVKILLNGGYGALANEHFIYFMIDNAEAITLSGQLVNKWTGQRTDKFLNKVLGKDRYWIYSDTDSGYYTLKNFADTIKTNDIQKKVDAIDEFCKEIVKPEIDTIVDKLCDYMNGYEQKMVWEREVIAEKSVWLAKKRYVMTVWDNEGVRYHEKPKLKFTGVDAVRSSTPMWSREALKDCYLVALTEGETSVQNKIQKIRESFDKSAVDDIAAPRGVNGLEKYFDSDNIYKKGTPIHVKGSLIHNHLIKEKGLNTNLITSGSKIKFVPLKSPNPIRQDVIAFERFLPKDFELEKYVDRDSIFKGAFLTPIESFLAPIGWNSEDTNTLF